MNSSKLIGLAMIIIVTLTGAIIHGRSSQRWGASTEMNTAGERLAKIPQDIPGWTFVSSSRITEASREMLEATGDIVRVYNDSISGSALNFSIVVGPPGTISVHSPEVCLPSRNFEQLGSRKEVEVRDAKGRLHKFWKVTFQARDADGQLLHVYYAWSIGDAWSAPDNPRYQFVGFPFLYKIQLAGSASPDAAPSDDPLLDFLKDLLPAVSSELVSAAPSNIPSTDEE